MLCNTGKSPISEFSGDFHASNFKEMEVSGVFTPGDVSESSAYGLSSGYYGYRQYTFGETYEGKFYHMIFEINKLKRTFSVYDFSLSGNQYITDAVPIYYVKDTTTVEIKVGGSDLLALRRDDGVWSFSINSKIVYIKADTSTQFNSSTDILLRNRTEVSVDDLVYDYDPSFGSKLFIAPEIVIAMPAGKVIRTDLQKAQLNGNVKSITTTRYEIKGAEKGEISTKQIDKYNERGNLMEQFGHGILKYSFGPLKKTTFKYDPKGTRLEENKYNADGSLDLKTKFTYDENGDPVAETQYNSDGSVWWKYIYKYDARGNQIQSNGFEKGEIEQKDAWIYKYDDKGNQIEVSTYNTEEGLRIEHTYTYNENGIMMEDNNWNADGTLWSKTTYIYEFDANGNWVKKTEIWNGKLSSITEREILY